MNWLENIEQLTVDITSYCNSHCGTCQRHVSQNDDTLHKGLELYHMPLTTWQKLMKDARNFGIKQIHMNGNWGDACMHPDLLKFAQSCVDHKIGCFISTNGSLRTKVFWKKLAKILQNYGEVTWCVDGLEDTHSIYRKKTSFTKIIENCKEFNLNGGVSRMMTTAFDHNLHQLNEIEELAEQIGCASIEIRRSHTSKEYFSDGLKISVSNVKPSHIRKTRFYNPDVHLKGVSPDLNSKCPWYNMRDVQIDPWGNLYTCCFASETRYGFDRQEDKFPGYENYSDKANNVRDKTLKEIFSSDFFQNIAPKINNGEWHICFDNCNIPNQYWQEIENIESKI